MTQLDHPSAARGAGPQARVLRFMRTLAFRTTPLFFLK